MTFAWGVRSSVTLLSSTGVTAFDSTTKVAYAAWVRNAVLGNAALAGDIACHRNNAGNTDGTIFYFASSSTTPVPALTTWNGSTATSYTGAPVRRAFVGGRWAHVAIVANGTSVIFYLNGVEIGRTAQTANWTIAGTRVTKIGGSCGLQGAGSMDLADVRMWAEADVDRVTPGMVRAIMAGHPAGATGRYMVDGPNGIDFSGRGNNLAVSSSGAGVMPGPRLVKRHGSYRRGAIGYTLVADAGAFAIAGSAAGLIIGRKLPAAAGALSVAGQSAALPIVRKLVATPGAVVVAGQPATLSIVRRIVAAAGALAVSGQGASLTIGRRLVAAPGELTVSGQSATLSIGRRIVASGGALVVSGQGASLAIGRRVVAAAGALGITGNASQLRIVRRLLATTGAVAVTGNAAQLRIGRRLIAGAGSLLTNFADALLNIVRGRPAAFDFTVHSYPLLGVALSSRASIACSASARPQISLCLRSYPV